MSGVARVKDTNRIVTKEDMDRKRIPYVITRYKNQFILVGLRYKRVVTGLDIVESTKIPLYKQAMDMQMGRCPQKEREMISHCFVVKNDNYSTNRFRYYEEI